MLILPFSIISIIAFVLFFIVPGMFILLSRCSTLKNRIIWAIITLVSIGIPLVVALPFAALWPELFEPRGQGDAYGFIIAGIYTIIMPWLTYSLFRYKNRKHLL